jgi:hypothetical protein
MPFERVVFGPLERLADALHPYRWHFVLVALSATGINTSSRRIGRRSPLSFLLLAELDIVGEAVRVSSGGFP